MAKEPNLDRFAQGLKDPQDVPPEDEVFTYCAVCTLEILIGDKCFKLDGEYICSCSCLLDKTGAEEVIAGEDD